MAIQYETEEFKMRRERGRAGLTQWFMKSIGLQNQKQTEAFMIGVAILALVGMFFMWPSGGATPTTLPDGSPLPENQ